MGTHMQFGIVELCQGMVNKFKIELGVGLEKTSLERLSPRPPRQGRPKAWPKFNFLF